MTLDDNWFTEIDPDANSAFSLKIRQKLHKEQSKYQRIEIFETEGFGKLMTIDGLVMLSERDNFIYHEMMAHPVLFSHPSPRNVVIIGGGDCGTLKEVLKHAEVESALQIEIDERVTRLAEEFFPGLCDSNNDPRAKFRFDDGIRWMKEASSNSVDVIIIDSTDPVGPAKGLFSENFYRDCFRVLTPDGLLSQQSESPIYHNLTITGPMHEEMRKSGFLDTLTLFYPQPVYPSGWWSTTLAGKSAPITFLREEQSADKPFDTDYYNEAIHRSAMAVPEFIRRQMMG